MQYMFVTFLLHFWLCLCLGKSESSNDYLTCFGGKYFGRVLDHFLKEKSDGKKASDINFYFSSRHHPDRVLLKHSDSDILQKIDFDIRREKTILIVHGFKTKGLDSWIKDMEEALLKWKDINVFTVDWRSISNTNNYFKAAVNSRTVGEQIAELFYKIAIEAHALQEPDISKWGQLYLIGHSLGAHAAAYAATELKRMDSLWNVGRITGLDPAQPCFKTKNDNVYLDKNDADFVDVIHTNGRLLKKFGLGLIGPIGHVDFYPNGGKVQPGCTTAEVVVNKFSNIFTKRMRSVLCNHQRSYHIFTDSIYSAINNDCKFWANEWDMSEESILELIDQQKSLEGCGQMGINADKGSCRGPAFLVTSSTVPYCKLEGVDSSAIQNLMAENNQ